MEEVLKLDRKPQYTKRQEYEVFRNSIERERSSYESHWRDLAEFILPRRARFTVTDNNRGEKVNSKIIDSTATQAQKTLRAGMMSGLTSPARPWFRLTTTDPQLAEHGPVKAYLHLVSRRMNTMFLRSNFYNVLPTIYGDMGVFGTGCMFVDRDAEQVLRFYPFPIGLYGISTDPTGRVNGFYREFRMTVRQIVEKFGNIDERTGRADWSNISAHVKNLWDKSEYEQWIEVGHVVRRNWFNFKPNMVLSKYKKYSSDYYERGFGGHGGTGYTESLDNRPLLRESGYDYFPILAPRWEVSAESIYGDSCPGMDSLGDVKQLQHGEKRSMEAIDKMVKPPLIGDPSLKKQKVSQLPGDITYLKDPEGKRLRTLYDVNFRVDLLEQKQEQVRSRVKRAFYEDLFLMLASSDRRQITAREIDERHEEKLLALGPVLEQTNQDLLDPVIDISYFEMNRREMLPPPPQEIAGQDLKVEYISIMAQAQKLVGIAGLDRFTGYVSNLAALDPNVLHKVEMDQMVDDYADITGINPSIVRTDKEVAKMREAIAQQEQQMQQQAEAQQMAATAKDMSQTEVEGGNALDRMLSNANAGSLVPDESGVM